MEPQQNESTANESESQVNPQQSATKSKKVITKKIIKGTKPASGKKKVVKKVVKTKKEVAVKNSQVANEIPNQAQSQIQSQYPSQNPNQNVLPPKMQRQVLPNQIYSKELPVQNREDQVNKQYQLKDIVNKTQTTVNYLKALSTTVVKPVIVQEVTTRKPIIAPVDYKEPINFFEGQPLSSDDLVIQNFFQNTTPVEDNSKEYENILNGNNNYLSQSYQYPSMQPQQYYNNNYLSQSVQYPSQNQTYFKSNTIATSTNFVRPQVEKVQLKNVSGEEFTHPKKKIVKKKKVKKSKISKNSEVKAVTQSQKLPVIQGNNNISNVKTVEKVEKISVTNNLQGSYPVASEQKKVMQQNDEEEDDDEKMPRDSVREKK